MTKEIFAGVSEFQVSDQREDIHYPVVVVYPTASLNTNHKIGLYDIEASFQSEIKSGQYPLVIISHGTGSSKLVFRTLAVFLARHGYIVAMPEHPFNNRNDNSRYGTLENLQDRPRHISQVIDFLTTHPQFSKNIDAGKIAVIGHSMGGYTALALGGGKPHTKNQIKYDENNKIKDSQWVDVQPDHRIKALVLLAPATGWYTDEGALTEVKVPILMMSGENDNMTPLFHAEIVKKGLPSTTSLTHHIVKDGTHFSFLSPFPKEMINSKFPPGNDPAGFDRRQFLEVMNKMILDFFKKTL